ncbi:hypothetical protein PAXRUDRAFT_173894, partial [Paxillus rubicundulus Ve08.2h10]
PAFLPDLNSREEAFSCIKAWIRSNRDYVLGERSGHSLSLHSCFIPVIVLNCSTAQPSYMLTKLRAGLT